MYKYKISKYTYKLKHASYKRKHIYRQKLKYYNRLQQSSSNVLHGGVEAESIMIPEEIYVQAPIEETEEQRRIREIREEEQRRITEENIRKQHLRDTIWNSTEFNKDSDKFNELRRKINALTIWPGDKYKYILILFVIKGLVNIENKDVLMNNVINQAKEYEKWIKQIEKFKKDNKISIRDRNNFVEAFSYLIKPQFYVKKRIGRNAEEEEYKFADASDIVKIIRYTDVTLADKINEIIVTRDNRIRINTVNEITDINNHNTWINDIRNIGKQTIQIMPIYIEFAKKIDQVKELDEKTKNWARYVVIKSLVLYFHDYYDYSLEQKQKIMKDTIVLIEQYDDWAKQIDDIQNLSEKYRKELKAQIPRFILHLYYSKLTLEQKRYNINTIIKLSKEYVKWINKIRDLKELELEEIQYFENYISHVIIYPSEFFEEEKIQKIEKIIKLAKQYTDFINQVNETTELGDEDKNVLKDKVKQIVMDREGDIILKQKNIDQYLTSIESYKKVLNKINKLNISEMNGRIFVRQILNKINELTINDLLKEYSMLNNYIALVENGVKQINKSDMWSKDFYIHSLIYEISRHNLSWQQRESNIKNIIIVADLQNSFIIKIKKLGIGKYDKRRESSFLYNLEEEIMFRLQDLNEDKMEEKKLKAINILKKAETYSNFFTAFNKLKFDDKDIKDALSSYYTYDIFKNREINERKRNELAKKLNDRIKRYIDGINEIKKMISIFNEKITKEIIKRYDDVLKIDDFDKNIFSEEKEKEMNLIVDRAKKYYYIIYNSEDLKRSDIYDIIFDPEKDDKNIQLELESLRTK